MKNSENCELIVKQTNANYQSKLAIQLSLPFTYIYLQNVFLFRLFHNVNAKSACFCNSKFFFKIKIRCDNCIGKALFSISSFLSIKSVAGMSIRIERIISSFCDINKLLEWFIVLWFSYSVTKTHKHIIGSLLKKCFFFLSLLFVIVSNIHQLKLSSSIQALIWSNCLFAMLQSR